MGSISARRATKRKDYEENRSGDRRRAASEEMLPEYRFDYRKARPNRFAARIKPGSRAVVLDPDVAEVFTTAESVNGILRVLIAIMPRRNSAS